MLNIFTRQGRETQNKPIKGVFPMRNIWIITILTLALPALSGPVWSQIAAPRLNPVTIDSSLVSPNRLIPAFNPAVLPWSGASRVAVGRSDLEAEETVLGITQSTNTGEGTVVQGRYVGESFALAAESYQLELTDISTGALSDFDSSLVAAAFRFGDMFSAGVSQQTAENVNGTNTDSATLPLLGATVRIGESIFVGLATGEETVENINAGVSTEADRTVTQIGVAYLARDGENGLHLEYYRQTVDAIDDPSYGTEDEQESAAFTVELIFSNVLVGYESMDNEISDTTGTVVEDVGLTTISLGWVPEEGLSIVASLQEEETTNAASGNVFRIETTVIAIAWLF